MVKTTGRLPDHVYSSVGGGSNALGIFQCFLTDEEVKLYAVDPEVHARMPVVLLCVVRVAVGRC